MQEPAGEAGSWPQWRGPLGLGISKEVGLPTTWSVESPNVVWKSSTYGGGNSSPIVSAGRVFLTSFYGHANPDGSKRKEKIHSVVALDFETGERLWQTEIFSSMPERKHALNTYAAPTPVSDGERVFAYFGSHVVALDVKGRIVWTEEIAPSYAEFSRYGAASSPVVTDDGIAIFQDREFADTEDVGWIVVLDKQTGAERWRREWGQGEGCCAYSTPLVFPGEAGWRMIVAHSGRVAEYGLENGETLWSQPFHMWQMVSSPVIEDDLLAIAGGAHGLRGSMAIRLETHAGATKPVVLWRTEQGAPQTSSPLLINGLLFTVTQEGVMICYQADTGEVLWRSRLNGGGYIPSLVAGDGKIYAVSQSGRTTVVAAAPEFELLGENLLERGGNASPAIAHRSLLIRTRKHVYRIEKEAGTGGS